MRPPLSLLAAAAFIHSLTNLPVVNGWHGRDKHINYTTVTGYFLQDDPGTNATTFDFKTTDFGLINRPYSTDPHDDPHKTKTQWQRFAIQLAALNDAAPRNTQYKLLFLGRHGDGFHNDAQAYYGTPAWNCYYSIRDGNSTVTWSDAHLSPLGVSQALAVNSFWASQLTAQKQPAPESYYTSPLTRCLQTANYTFSGLHLPHRSPFIPTVKELLRESISGHTCDRRKSRSYIHSSFPSYRIEKGFADDDPLWQALHGETTLDQSDRSKLVLDEIFQSDEATYISITSHSGEIGSILGVLGHRSFSLATAAVIPVLVKAETLPHPDVLPALESFAPLCTCTSPPAVTATSSACSDPTGTGEVPVYPTLGVKGADVFAGGD